MHAPSSRRPTKNRVAARICGAALIALAIVPAAASAATPGTIDTTFGSGGIANGGTGNRLFGAAVQADGKVLAVGETGAPSTVLLERFAANGQPDGSFGSGGVVRGPAVTSAFDTGSLGRSVAVQSDGKIVVAGKATSPDASGTDGILVERYNSNGSIDSSFGSHGVALALTQQLADGYGVAIQSDGKIVATGSANASGSGGVTPRVAVVRFNTNGSLDSGFANHGTDVIDLGAYSVALGVALQSDGKIVIVGSQAPGLQVPNALIARLTSTGARDPSFNGNGAFTHQYAIGAANSAFNAVAVQKDGKIVAAGAATSGNTGANAVIARFTSGGTPDGSFGSGGVVFKPSATSSSVTSTIPGATGVTLAGNGDIVASGTLTVNGVSDVAAWAVRSNGATETGFGLGGVVTTPFGTNGRGEGNGLAVGADGKFVVAGDSRTIFGAYSGVVVRYNGFGATPPPPPPALKASLKSVSGRYKTSTVARHGLKLGVNCNQACSFKSTLTASAGTARKLKIKSKIRKCKKVHGKRRCTTTRGYTSLTLASAKGSLRAAGTGTLTLKLGRSYVKALEKQKSVSVTLQVVVTSSATKKSTTLKKGLTFKR